MSDPLYKEIIFIECFQLNTDSPSLFFLYLIVNNLWIIHVSKYMKCSKLTIFSGHFTHNTDNETSTPLTSSLLNSLTWFQYIDHSLLDPKFRSRHTKVLSESEKHTLRLIFGGCRET